MWSVLERGLLEIDIDTSYREEKSGNAEDSIGEAIKGLVSSLKEFR